MEKLYSFLFEQTGFSQFYWLLIFHLFVKNIFNTAMYIIYHQVRTKRILKLNDLHERIFNGHINEKIFAINKDIKKTEMFLSGKMLDDAKG